MRLGMKGRGIGDILIAVVDGLKGFPEAINAVFPQTVVQTCIVHLIRHSLDFASWKDRKPVAQALKTVYRATDANAGQVAMDAFADGPWGTKYPAIALSWRRNWNLVIPFFAFPEAVRRIIYTTNAIEALNSKLRRAVRARGHFPNDDAATKLLYLSLNRAAAEWKRPPREWSVAKTQFAIMFNERFVNSRSSTRLKHKIPDSPMIAPSSADSTLDFGSLGPVGRSAADVSSFHFATVF
jgi:putative transposase